MQAIKNETAAKIHTELAHGIGKSWRGRHLNIGITTKHKDELELLQHYLYIHNGILAGSFPSTLRFQPNLVEYAETLLNTVRVIASALSVIQAGSDLFAKELRGVLLTHESGGLNL